MRDIVRQLSTAFRSLSRQPAVMLPAVLTLALGIGANTALFAYLAAILWPRIDAPHFERIVSVYAGTDEEPRRAMSYPEYEDFLKSQNAVVDLVGYSRFGASIAYAADGERTSFAWGGLVTGNYFGFFNTRPTMGRLLQPADDRPDAPPVVVLSHRFWQGTLGGSPDVVGRELRINGVGMTVVGVAGKDFQGFNLASAIYVPASLTDRATAVPRLHERDAQWVNITGRLAPGVTREKAQAAMAVLGRSLDATAPFPDGKPRRMDVVLYGEYDPGWGDPEWLDRTRILMGVASAFLLLACVSIANLLLARAISKQREWGIRASLGASRAWLLSGVLAESLVLCLMGGVVGLGVGALLGRRIEAFVMTPPGGLGDWAEGTRLLQFDGRIAAFAVLVTVFCALLGALGPVLRVMRGDLLGPLKSDASASGTGGMGVGLAPRKVLVVLQVALSLLLLLTGGLLVRTLGQAQRVDPGFDPDGLLLVTVNIPRNVMAGEGGAGIYRRVLEQTRSTPGVTSASLSHILPVSGLSRMVQAASLDRQDQPFEVAYNAVSPAYFETIGIPILAGRPLDERDRKDAPRTVVVSHSMARKLWGEQAAVGRVLRLIDLSSPEVAERPFEVVGVAKDVRSSLMEEPAPLVYLSNEQREHPRMTLLVRSSVPTAALAPELRRALHEAHPDLAIVNLVGCREHIAQGLAEQRMYAEVAGLFALLGLGVAVVGLFGLLSYSVSLRGRELSIRMAIGARPQDVRWLVMGQGMALVAWGVVGGVAGAFALTRAVSGMLYGVEATDPLTFVAVPVVLALVSLIACYFPARRAARLDPTVALKGA
ncbi:MAG TPA: ADOP family duplicated permease [Thermoanaerobaculia bacterium]|nr:ADOP family duplicated permease [Thermoanaerobaculia bacterium]